MLTDLHDAILSSLSADFPSVPSVEAYPHLRRKVVVPAIFVEMDDMQPTPTGDPGTEQLALDARFRAFVVFDRVTSDDHMQAVNLAAGVALSIYLGGRFGQRVGPARITRVAADDFAKSELIGFVVWVVEWSHLVRLGESIWEDDGVTPSEVWLGWSPEIGAAHVDDYEQVEEVPGA